MQIHGVGGGGGGRPVKQHHAAKDSRLGPVPCYVCIAVGVLSGGRVPAVVEQGGRWAVGVEGPPRRPRRIGVLGWYPCMYLACGGFGGGEIRVVLVQEYGDLVDGHSDHLQQARVEQAGPWGSGLQSLQQRGIELENARVEACAEGSHRVEHAVLELFVGKDRMVGAHEAVAIDVVYGLFQRQAVYDLGVGLFGDFCGQDIENGSADGLAMRVAEGIDG